MIIADIIFLFVFSTVYAEIVNFIVVYSDTLLILFALGSIGYSSAASEKDSILLAAAFGFLSDIISLNHIFYFTFFFPLLVFFSNYVRRQFNISYSAVITFCLLIFVIYFAYVYMFSIFEIVFFVSVFILFYNIYILTLKIYKVVDKNAEER